MKQATSDLPASLTLERERNWQLDVLRGFAMMGILFSIINDFGWSLPFADQFYTDSGVADRMWWSFHDTFIGQRFIGLLSLMFGVGIGSQIQRWKKAHRPVWPFFLRRMGILALFGVVNTTFFWWGEILLVYALFGTIALAFSNLPTRLLLVLSLVIFFILHPVWELAATPVIMEVIEPWFYAKYTLEDILRIYRSGGFSEMIEARWSEYLMLFPYNNQWMRTALALIIAGTAIGKKGWHRSLLSSPTEWLGYGTAAAGVCAFGTLLSMVTGVKFAAPNDGIVLFFACSFWILCCVLAYVFFVAVLCDLLGEVSLLRWIAKFGRMALTNYMLAALVYSLIYENNGLGLYGELQGWTQIPIATALLVCEVCLSVWWLGRYQYGPLEWLWRRLSYAHSLRMNRTPRAT